MGAEQHARGEGNARITQVVGDHVTYAPGAGPAPRAALGLPDAPAVLVGRDGPVKELVALLGDGGPTVAVVAGLAGVGKSALAVATAHRAVELGWFGDRVFFLPLRGYAPGGGVSGPEAVREMLRRLGIRDTDMPESPEGRASLYQAQLAGFAQAGRRVLIVADDAGEVGQVRDLVPAGTAHRLLVTSRHRLVHPGFTAQVVTLDELAPAPAAELLAGAVLRTWPQDRRPAAEPGALAEVAERCGRLPLALTVAGALLAGDPGLPVGELAQQLADARTRLAKLDSELDAGVRAAFDLSYARLPEDQARIFRLLTVNPGPDCATMYARLLTGEATADLRPKLAALVRASLLAEEPVGSGRWRMHDLVRLYARERGEECAAEDGREDATDALLGFLVLGAEVARHVIGVDTQRAAGPGLPSMEEVLRWLGAERAMLVAAVGFAVEAGRPEIAVELGTLLMSYLQLYRYGQDALVVARTVLAATEGRGSPEEIGGRLYDLGLAYLGTDQPEEAMGPLTQALTVFRENSLRMGEGKALNMLGSVYEATDRWAEAEQARGEALDIFRELGIRHAEGTVLSGLARIYERAGRLDDAIAALRQSVSLMHALDDRHREASALNSLADVLWRAEHQEESLAAREQALATQREFGNRKQAVRTLTALAGSLVELGREEDARARYEEALQVLTEEGDPHRQGEILGNLGLIHRRAGRPEQALELLERACVLLAESGGRAGEVAVVSGLALTLYALDRHAEAAEAFERAAGLYAGLGDAEWEEAARAAAADLREQATRPRRWWHRLTGGASAAGPPATP
ncbi:tetratricopeptide repeat protein [Streptomyces sp. NBC_00091]|uniref:ATP-binding protein n=1 Tax=Streptomyces sp. NBC_00091 TaxID=2975648 RepID=UPI00224E1DD7|nr:tetratricopeptide repeat protein [Streptomyces sp. NBC_00091]MCX5377734.1 tetratricopeptide repeat protein [Streptomyces sp. NBC_00091]